MIDTEVYAAIRQYKKNGLSIRKTAKSLGMSRNTVKRYWDGAHTPDEKKDYPAQLGSPLKEQVMEALKKYYEDNKDQLTGKQAINAKTAWVEIRETFAVGESTIRRYVRELQEKYPDAFIPLSFEPGEVMQVDWCEVKISYCGHIWKFPVFCAVLPYSYGIFAMIMPNMKTPCFIEAIIEAFNFFGGVPQRTFFDNLKTAVLSGHGKNAVKQERFRMLEAHYAFEAVFMNPESGNEKGAVENLCSLIRQVAFTPIPKGDTLEEVQEQVLRRCLDYNRFHKIRDRQKPIAPMLEEERKQLMPLPLKPFNAYAVTEAVVGSDLTFRYEATKYSVPQEYVGKTITVHATSYKIEAWYKGTLASTHTRSITKGEHRYLPEHYLSLLEKRPRAIPNALPLKYGVLPPEMEKFRSLNQAKDKYEQLANVLLLGRHIDAETLLHAVDYANKTGSPSYDSVRFYLEAHNLSINNIGKINTSTADRVVVEKPQFTAYDELFTKEGNDNE